MKIYKITAALHDYEAAEERQEEALFVLADEDDPDEFSKMAFWPAEILRIDIEEIKNIKVSANLVKSHAKQYINSN